MNTRRRSSNSIRQWLPVGAAGGLLAAVVGVGIVSGGAGGGASAGTTTVTAAATQPQSEAIAPTTAPVTVAAEQQIETVSTDAPVQKVALNRAISNGMAGDDVERIQKRLVELGFDPGPVDGIYGSLTRQAIWAFEKLVLGTPRQQATGVVTPEMWDRMQDPIQIQPRRPTGGLADHVEIYLPEQVMIIFHGDNPALVTHVSSGELDADGNPAPYCEEATITDRDGVVLDEPIHGISCGESKTPGGIFTINRFVEGKRVSPLGGMMNPAYFNYGIAIHGADNVPLEPASHGCIRVNQHIGAYFQLLLDRGDRVLVWNGEKEPEEITEDESLPYFDRFTADTTTTTSTTTSTTVAPDEPDDTVAPTTTPPATTTTTTTTTTTVPTTTTTTVPEDGGGDGDTGGDATEDTGGG